MPGMPVYYVAKGKEFEMLDTLFNSPAGRAAALQRLNSGDGLLALAQDHKSQGRLTETNVTHFQQHWLGAGWGWNKYPVAEVLAEGYRKALNVAGDKPIESLWVCADEKQFQVYVCESDQQITVIIYTPPPKYQALASVKFSGAEPIWVVKQEDKDDKQYAGGTYEDPVKTVNGKQIISRKVKF